jgi:hypothetical protein
MPEPLQAKDLPELPHYVTVAQAAKLLDISKTSVFYDIYVSRKLREAFRVGDEEDGDRPVVLLMRSEVEMLAKQLQAPPVKTLEQLQADWNRRVKDWGTESGWMRFRISDKGRPRKELVEDYLAVHPNDPRPE